MTCSKCKATDKTIYLTQQVRVGKQVVEFVLCSVCWRDEQKEKR